MELEFEGIRHLFVKLIILVPYRRTVELEADSERMKLIAVLERDL